MKTFLNVLYRRILYKIPLKLLLVLLAVFGVLFACFSNAEFSCTPIYVETFTSNGVVNIYWDGVQGADTFCLNASFNSFSYDFTCTNNYTTLQQQEAICVDKSEYPDNAHSICIDGRGSFIGGAVYFSSDCLRQPYTSLQCQTEYNLIPISSVDQNYCTTNNLCPSVIPSGTGNLTQLYINNILHVGAPTILMNIPDEIDWDYAYTMGGNIMNIDIVGYNVDYQAVEDEINIQKYKPTGEELSLIVSNIIPLFVPGLCIILLLYFIFKFIKKVF